ncbi:type II toxin-antitoxin system HicA family toxin [Candidatus Avoscillospira sp. LCP25S3_F1]|uniref:type II toxin-antitoxin system HicA family toxin n=1 Tax=Candidatus Avoscillospira sp. LCP25S3_F1 TaxID=3438825 RepID=UPI003F91292C
MGQKEKLIQRLKSRPKDFTFEEAESLLRYFSYERSDKGRTSGSRVMFVSAEHPPILMHKPHPRKELLSYQVKQLLELLSQEGLV